jgi:hypothetical protein
MSPERRQRILDVAAELEAEGQVATNAAVYARVHGHRGHVVATLKARRAERAAAGGVLVAEEEDDNEPEDETIEIPASVLAEDLAQLKSAYEGYHLALEKLWDLEAEGVWDENISNRQTFLEKTLVKNLQEQERVRGELERARIREAVFAAQQQHDAGIPEARALAEQFLQAVATVAHLCEDLSEVFSTQVDGWFAFRDTRGHQAFDVADGPTYAAQLFAQFFGGDPRARDAFALVMHTRLTVGMMKQALAACPRLQPFSPRAIESYLQQQSREGTANGSHS